MTGKYATERLAADAAGIARALELLRAGGLVALPTETVYGLAARADSAEYAVARIFEAKGRPTFNPLIVHVASLAEVERLAKVLGKGARTGGCALARALDAGPAAPPRRQDRCSGQRGATHDRAAFPGPSRLCARLSRRWACLSLPPAPTAAASSVPTAADHVLATLDGRIDAVLDAGPCVAGVESTIVAVREDGRLEVLRPGPVVLDAGIASGGAIEAPGQLASHYAPGKPIRLNAQSMRRTANISSASGTISGDCQLSQAGDLERSRRPALCLPCTLQAPRPTPGSP